MSIKHIFLLTGILFASVLSAQTDYFWVGGQGEWANLNNWITSAGIAPDEVPDANDNVIFNENSFNQYNDTVFVFTKNPECKNMIWENLQYPVVLAGGADTTSLSIYGSLTFDTLLFNDYRGKINFQAGTTGNTITCAGNRFFADIYFDGDGEWILQDTLMTWDTTDWQARMADPAMKNPSPDPFIYLQKGTLQTNGQVIIAEGFKTTTQNPRLLNIEDSKFYIIGPWDVKASGLTLKSFNSVITIRGLVTNSNGDGPNLVYYKIIKLPDAKGNAGTIKSTDLRTQIHYALYQGVGELKGETISGQEGFFTVDTLIILGGTFPNQVSGNFDTIYYGYIGTPGDVKVSSSYISKFIFNAGGELKGKDNNIDSLFFRDALQNAAKGIVFGKNNIDYLFFQSEGSISSDQSLTNNITTAIFRSDGYFGGYNIINSLSLNSGYWYKIKIDSLSGGGSPTFKNVLEITNNIDVTGGCKGGMTWFTSSLKTYQAIIDIPSPITTDYLSVMDIYNKGADLTVNHGIDLGNNNNITIFEDSPRTLYWTGGSGNWRPIGSNVSHWTATPTGTGGECPPTVLDNVHFTNDGLNLNETVNINTKHACTGDMIWEVTNNCKLTGPDTNNLHVWGKMLYNNNVDANDFRGIYYFESRYDTLANGTVVYNDIDFAGNTANKSVVFYGDNGAWKLQDVLSTENDSVILRMGRLNTHSKKVNCKNFISIDDSLNRSLILGASEIIVHQFGNAGWWIKGKRLDFNSDQSTIISVGDKPLNGPTPLKCNIRSTPGQTALVYYNIEFHAQESELQDDGYCEYNLVDFKAKEIGNLYIAKNGKVTTGPGKINILTFHEDADNCIVDDPDTFTINLVEAYSLDDTIKGNHNVSVANFYKRGYVTGLNWIGDLTFFEDGIMEIQNEVDNALFLNDGYIHGNNTFGTLTFTPENKYYLQHEGVQTITNLWDVTGTCISPIRIQSDSIGSQAFVEVQYPNVEIEYTSFRDLYAVDYNGNIPYTAKSSVDMGNNTNWNFTQVDTNDYYWINGTGNWSDPQHWSDTTGGPPIDCLPRELNSVIFDDKSFNNTNDIVTIDIPNASCLDMKWIHTPGSGFYPKFTGDENSNLFIYGSLLLNSNMDYDYRGLLYFDEISGDKKNADEITTKGNVILNDIRFQGINGEWVLKDNLTLLVEAPVFRTIYLEHGTLNTGGNDITTGSFQSEYNNKRNLIITNSAIDLTNPNDYGWIIDGDNLTFEADNSIIINNGINSSIKSYDGDTLKFYNIKISSPAALDSLINVNNIAVYNYVEINGPSTYFGGNFIADLVIFNGAYSGMYETSETNIVILNAVNCQISGEHHINEGYVNFFGTIYGHNDFDYCIFNSDGVFRGENTFDTLILTPGQGNTFYFEEEKSQTIYDSLFLRGNQCQNITIKSLNLSKTAYIKKDGGVVQCDFMNVYNVGTEGTATFYAGKNSTPLPNPDNPPPGWIFDDSQGYIYGFPDFPVHFCYGDVYEIPSVNFNGGPNTTYIWRNMVGDTIHIGPELSITEPGVFSLQAIYTDSCSFTDIITVDTITPPVVILDPGPYCEGDIIDVTVTPSNKTYFYEWSNGSTDENLVAQLNLNGTLGVQATEAGYGCKSADTTNMQVEPVPKPDDNLPPDQTLNFGETITLDAGDGDTYSWTADNPLIIIPDPTQRYITVGGVPDPGVTYKVDVSLGICSGKGDVKITEFPRCKCDVPNAFSPNGDNINDVLFVRGSGLHDLEFRIYDRYGKLVFQTDNLEQGWDGTYNGTKQPKEVYTFYLKGICEDGGVIEKKGNITIIR